MSMNKPYPSDLTDEQWELVEPVITAWKARHPSVSGHQGKYAMREIVNAILYQNRTGCQWEFLPPSLVLLDTQSIHVAVGVPATTTGRDAAKRVPGRKRCLAVDVLGLVVAVVVLAASAHENTAGIALLDQVAGQSGSVKKALVDQGFKKKVVEHGKNVGIDVEIVERNPDDKGFVPQAKRWIVEQTNGILMFYRRLVRDYEHRPASSRSRVLWAMTSVMSRRLTGRTIASWRTA
ncbi:transposase [Streptomyces sp. NPDC058467]|uniref:transposase n=1 Tax=Streptomyces sp. NPDC058467 TaxID=3346513 RepID=UPI00364C4733